MYNSNQIFIVVDTNTQRYVLPDFLASLKEKYQYDIPEAHVLVVPAGEEQKNIDSIIPLWHALVQQQATRMALLINLGGGVVTDMGGFVAATYRRGIDYINVPTTLLSMVDAGHGGKTGFDFEGLKNFIGSFYPPKEVWIEPRYLKTLPREEILSGYAELIKHALLSGGAAFNEALEKMDLFLHLPEANDDELAICERMINESIAVKQLVVELDPKETGLRKCLNLGHTIGHALEELSFQKGTPLRHGYAVMQGLVAELWLSTQIMGLSMSVVDRVAQCMQTYYGAVEIAESDFESILAYMRNDKKNALANEINFTLLSDVGKYEVNQIVSKEMIMKSLCYLNENL